MSNQLGSTSGTFTSGGWEYAECRKNPRIRSVHRNVNRGGRKLGEPASSRANFTRIPRRRFRILDDATVTCAFDDLPVPTCRGNVAYRFWQRVDPATPHRGHFGRQSVRKPILKVAANHGPDYAEGSEDPRESGGYSGEARAGTGTLCQLQGGGAQQAGQARGLPSLSGTVIRTFFFSLLPTADLPFTPSYPAFFFQYFKRDADELEGWIYEKLQAASDESYKDPTNLQAKIQKHQAFEAEVAAHSNAIVLLDNTGSEMIAQHHFASDVIRKRLGMFEY